MTTNWIPLTRWQKFIRFFTYYLNPWRRCMRCGKRFFNPDFWRLYSTWYGVPEYCSWECAEEEIKELVDECKDEGCWIPKDHELN